MRKINVAVIGVGHLGEIHARIYKELPHANLVGVCDINKDKLEKVCALLKTEGSTDYKDFFGKAEAVSIATPTKSHFEVAHDFLKHGIHILVEKPFTSELKQADALIHLSEDKKLILQVGHIERFNSAFYATRSIIQEPKFIECHRLSPFTGRSLDVGVVLDLMIHDIDIVLGLVNAPIKRIEAVGAKILTHFEDIANARITFKNGCICNLTASRVSDESMRKIRIFMKNAYISLDYRNEEAHIYRKVESSITKEKLPIEREQPLQKELASFIDCAISNKEPLVSGPVAREALAVAFTIQKKIWQSSPTS